MSNKMIVKLNQNPAEFGEVANKLKESIFESSLPKQCYHSYYEDKNLGLSIGVRDSIDIVNTASPYACNEFIFIIEGMVDIKNSQTGKVETVTAGESIVIPQGYDCQWYQPGYLRNFYVIYEPTTEADSEEITEAITEANLEEMPDTPVCKHIIYIDEKSDTPWQVTSDGFNKKIQYQSHNQKFTAGVWQGNPFKTDIIAFPYNEFILLQEGSLLCIDDQENEYKISAGEALFIPQGARCSWETKDKISIHFVQIK